MSTTCYRYWTNAPEAYDYHYVSTFGRATDRYGKEWRLIEVSFSYLNRFTQFQVPRYESGLKKAHAVGSKEAQYLQLEVPSGS
jgi:hypothetical protein